MKIIFSRKGFDSGYGGVASPIFPNGQILSMPIPSGGSPHRFRDVQTPVGSMGPLASHLTQHPGYPFAGVHLDPDLDSLSLPRKEGWKGSLGQAGCAQSHLQAQGVSIGDVFLFFGWFREVKQTEKGYSYGKANTQKHLLFGYLQIGEILPFGSKPDKESILSQHPWLHDHSHIDGLRSANNTVYVGAEELILPDGRTGLPGFGAFDRIQDHLVLTAPGLSKSKWKLPSWFGSEQGSNLTYHKDPGRWETQPDGSVILSSVAKGQEFVLEMPEQPDSLDWLKTIASSPLRGSVPPATKQKGP